MTVCVVLDIVWDEGRRGACAGIVFPYDHQR